MQTIAMDTAIAPADCAPQAPHSLAILSTPDEFLFTRAQAAEFLTALGLKTTPNTLATWFTRNPDGPPVEHFGRFPRYRAGALRIWVRSRMTAPRRTSSEARKTAA